MSKVGIIGAGTMGQGIAKALSLIHISEPTRLID